MIVTPRHRVLLVDDEPHVLEALSRTLRKSYSVVHAESGAEGLAALATRGPFAAVISDMRMPRMNGAEFLARARVVAGDVVRVLLTGHADIEAAAAAVNDGRIFRFLQKPCRPELLEQALAAAVAEHRLLCAERDVLEQTLRGSVEVLTDVLAIVSPVASARAIRVKATAGGIARVLNAPDAWAIETAAMFSELGAIAVPPDVLQRHYAGYALDGNARALIRGAPDVATQLIAHIPRLEPVKAILRAVESVDDAAAPMAAVRHRELMPLGAHILRAAVDYDTLEHRGAQPEECLARMEARPGIYDSAVLAALRALKHTGVTAGRQIELPLSGVHIGMTFARDVVTTNGLVLIGRGQKATASLIHRIRSSWLAVPLKAHALVNVETGQE